MSRRLASFGGPSTPSASPVRAPPQQRQQKTPQPASPRQPVDPKGDDTTYHRKLRAALLDIRFACQTWDDLVLRDGLSAAKGLVDARTELSNALAILPKGALPRTMIATPAIEKMQARSADLQTVIAKLRKTFNRLDTIITSLETLLVEAMRAKGLEWCTTQALWTTWPLERFVSRLPALLHTYHRSLQAHIRLASAISPPATPFDVSKAAIREWADMWHVKDGRGTGDVSAPSSLPTLATSPSSLPRSNGTASQAKNGKTATGKAVEAVTAQRGGGWEWSTGANGGGGWVVEWEELLAVEVTGWA